MLGFVGEPFGFCSVETPSIGGFEECGFLSFSLWFFGGRNLEFKFAPRGMETLYRLAIGIICSELSFQEFRVNCL